MAELPDAAYREVLDVGFSEELGVVETVGIVD
jgi:hypothetical protein